MFHGRVLTCTVHIRRIQNPCNWQIKLLNGHFPIIREATENGIPSYDVKKSETAKVIMYILGTVRRRFGFLLNDHNYNQKISVERDKVDQKHKKRFQNLCCSCSAF